MKLRLNSRQAGPQVIDVLEPHRQPQQTLAGTYPRPPLTVQSRLDSSPS